MKSPKKATAKKATAKKATAKKATAKKATAKKTTAKRTAASKPPRNYDAGQIDHDYATLKEVIVQCLPLSQRPAEVVPKPNPTDIVVIASMLAAKGHEINDAAFEEARKYWLKAFQFLKYKERQESIEDAVRKLLFKKNETNISKAGFLKKLLPNDSVAKRVEILEQALEKILDHFGTHFHTEASGWPQDNLSAIISSDPTAEGITMKNYWLSRVNKGIDVKLACTIAPIVLSWRNLISSPQARGSMGITARKASDAPRDVDEV